MLLTATIKGDPIIGWLKFETLANISPPSSNYQTNLLEIF